MGSGFLALFLALVANAGECEATGYMQETASMPLTASRGYKTYSATRALDVGNYDVEFVFGDKDKPTTNWVKFEGRRIALEKIATKPGEMKKVLFTARVKGPIAKEDKPTGEAPFPYQLNLTVISDAPRVAMPKITRNDSARTIYLCGDSTVTDQQAEPWGSWGQCLCVFFKEGTAVSNFARSGLTTQSFLSQGRLERILAHLKPCDYVLVQFGHNDQKVERLAPETGYRENLNFYIDKIKEKGATPVIISPMERLRFNAKTKEQEGKTLEKYAAAAKAVAEDRNVAYIELNDASWRMYGSMGCADAPKMLCTYSIEDQKRDFWGDAGRQDGKNLRNLQDKTHHSIYGAYVLAHFIADRLGDLFPELKASRREGYREVDVNAVEQDPAIPPSGFVDTTRPEGDVGNKE